MAKPNYSFEKRQRELAKQKKKAEKDAEKAARKRAGEPAHAVPHLAQAATRAADAWANAEAVAFCRQALDEPANRSRKITAIAFDHGFSDYATFSRLFKQQYGATPRSFQQKAAQTRGGTVTH